METMYQILGIVAAGLLMWLLYYQVKTMPALFSKANLSKSLTTLGVLGLLLIGVVVLLVWIARM